MIASDSEIQNTTPMLRRSALPSKAVFYCKVYCVLRIVYCVLCQPHCIIKYLNAAISICPCVTGKVKGGGVNTIAITTAMKRRRRRELVYSCGEIELLPPCTEAPPPWRGNPPFAGGGCARRREALIPRKRRNNPPFAGGGAGGRCPPSTKGGIFLLLRGVSSSSQLLNVSSFQAHSLLMATKV